MRFRVVKPIYGVLSFVFLGLVFLLLPIFFLLSGFALIGFIFLLLWIYIFIFAVVDNCFIKSIVVTKNGIKYISLFKKYNMKWQDINTIGIGYIPIKKTGAKPWIYFSSDKIIMPTLSANMLCDHFYIVNYRKSIINEVKRYWAKDIAGLDSEYVFN